MSSTIDTVAVPERAPPQSLWGAVREALAGAHGHDYTEGPIGRALLLLAVPMVLEMRSSRSSPSSTCSGSAGSGPTRWRRWASPRRCSCTIYALGMGLGIGATAMVARRIGEKNPDGAARAAVQAILLGSVAVASRSRWSGRSFAPELLALMGASPGRDRERVASRGSCSAGTRASLLLFLINAIFRGAGDAAIAMRSLWIANALQPRARPAARSSGRVRFPELGVMGAAVATTIGRGIGRALRSSPAHGAGEAASSCTRTTSARRRADRDA